MPQSGVRLFPLKAGCARVAALAMAASFNGWAAEPPKASPGALDVLVELGLPDARQAKWVRASLNVRIAAEDLPAREGRSLNGNAWLVREEPKGRVTLILSEARVVHAVLIKPGEPPSDEDPAPGAEPPARVEPADLKADLATIQEALESFSKQSGKPHEDFDYQANRRTQATGLALLFLAHLRQQGRPEAEALLGKALAAGPPQEALDSAINLLAEGRLAELNERWGRTGDAKAYAAGLDALAAQFHRGWTNRGAALLLAGRLRGEASGAPGGPAAELLRGLRAADLSKLPLGRNWILPESEGEGEEAAMRQRFRIVRGRAIRSGPSTKSQAGNAGEAGSSVEAFFLQRAKAAGELVPLLGSHELLRLLRENAGGSHVSFSSHREQSEDEAARAAYQEMSRPYEMGELAAQLLQGIEPGRDAYLFRNDDGGASPALAAWVKSLEGKSDEEIAWLYLRSSESSNDQGFSSALAFLLKQGGPEMIAKLREVFLDPAVWAEGAIGQMTGPLKTFVAKLGPEGEAFGAKLLAMVKAEMAKPKESDPGQIDQSYRKMMAAQEAQQLKQLEQVLHPRTLATLLTEFVAAKDDEAAALLEAVRLAAQESGGAAEPQIFQAAAHSKSTAARGELLSLLLRDDPTADPASKSVQPALDAATLAAIKELLADESLPSESGGEPVSIAQQATLVLVLPRLDEKLNNAWQELTARGAASVAQAWLRTAAHAIAEGRPIPPVPGGPNLKKEEVAELARSWAGQTGEQVLASVRALPPGKQVGLIGALVAGAKWEEPLVRAQLTVAQVNLATATELPAASWKGRPFDEKLRREIAEALRSPALAGAGLVVTLTAAHPLSGVTLSVTNREEKLQRAELEQYGIVGLAGRAPVDGVVASFARVWGAKSSAAMAAIPLWKDAAVAQSWAEENKFPAPSANAPEAGEPERASRSDPAALAAIVTRIESGDPSALAAFQFINFASPIEAELDR